MIDDDQYKELSEIQQRAVDVWDYVSWAVVPMLVGAAGLQLAKWAWSIMRYAFPTFR